MRRGASLIAAALIGSGCSTSDSRCNAANCANLLDVCHQQFAAEPSIEFQSCLDAGSKPANFDSSKYCPAACNASTSGALIQCLTKHPECGGFADGGSDAALLACTPPGDGGTGDPACQTACGDQRTACDGPCFSKSGYQACMDCAASCGLAWAACDKQCG